MDTEHLKIEFYRTFQCKTNHLMGTMLEELITDNLNQYSSTNPFVSLMTCVRSLKAMDDASEKLTHVMVFQGIQDNWDLLIRLVEQNEQGKKYGLPIYPDIN